MVISTSAWPNSSCTVHQSMRSLHPIQHSQYLALRQYHWQTRRTLGAHHILHQRQILRQHCCGTKKAKPTKPDFASMRQHCLSPPNASNRHRLLVRPRDWGDVCCQTECNASPNGRTGSRYEYYSAAGEFSPATDPAVWAAMECVVRGLRLSCQCVKWVYMH